MNKIYLRVLVTLTPAKLLHGTLLEATSQLAAHFPAIQANNFSILPLPSPPRLLFLSNSGTFLLQLITAASSQGAAPY